MQKLIITATIALVSTVAASSAFAGCHDYSYDSSYSSGYTTTYTPTYDSGYSSYSGY
ncbi:MAG: hypothetical protein U1E49_09430 [Hyphomicrobiaceae bacterium]